MKAQRTIWLMVPLVGLGAAWLALGGPQASTQGPGGVTSAAAQAQPPSSQPIALPSTRSAPAPRPRANSVTPSDAYPAPPVPAEDRAPSSDESRARRDALLNMAWNADREAGPDDGALEQLHEALASGPAGTALRSLRCRQRLCRASLDYAGDAIEALEIEARRLHYALHPLGEASVESGSWKQDFYLVRPDYNLGQVMAPFDRPAEGEEIREVDVVAAPGNGIEPPAKSHGDEAFAATNGLDPAQPAEPMPPAKQVDPAPAARDRPPLDKASIEAFVAARQAATGHLPGKLQEPP